TSGTTYEPQRFDNVLTGANQTGGRFRINMSTDVALGGYANAFKAQVELNDSGGSVGLLSVGCFELVLPTGGIGALSCLELEMTCPATGFATGQNFPSYIFANCTGTTIAGFQDGGVFVHFDAGNVAATGNLIGANYSTIRLAFGNAPAWTNYYIPLSTAEGTFTTVKPILQGATGAGRLTQTYNGVKAIQSYTTCGSTNTGTTYEPQLFDNTLTGAGQVGGRFRVNMTTDVRLGGWANAFKASIACSTNGSTTGVMSV
ncbi:unnamed protein product, partial [marine sediment metagenome]